MPGVAFIRVYLLTTLNPCVAAPLGIHQLAAVLARKNIPVTDIFDMQVHRPKEIRERFERIVSQKPDVIGLSALSHYRPLVKQVSAFFKKRLPGVKIVLGGALVSSNPDCLADLPDVDYGLAGEGEESLPMLLDDLAAGREPGEMGLLKNPRTTICHSERSEESPLDSGNQILHSVQDDKIESFFNSPTIPGLVTRTADGIRHRPPHVLSIPLDDLPPIDWDRADLPRYNKFLSISFGRGPFAVIMTSRGCPFACIFCHKIFGNQFRARSVENVMEEMHRLRRGHGIRRFEIVDDIFNWDYDRASRILARIRDEMPDVKLDFPNGLRLDRLDEPFVKLMADAHCDFLPICIESAVPRIQKVMRKNLDLGKVADVVRWTKQNNIRTVGIFMIGLPTETPEEMEMTIDYARGLDVGMVAIQTANPYEGTPMREMMGDAAAPSDLGDMYGHFAAGGAAMEPVNRKKMQAMRSMMYRPGNWVYAWRHLMWRLWWMGLPNVWSYFVDLFRDSFSRDRIYSVDTMARHRDKLEERIEAHLQ